MKRPSDMENIKDFHRYYEGGWIGWPQETYVMPVALRTVRDNTATFYSIKKLKPEGAGICYITDTEPTMFSWPDILAKISFGSPPVGMAQIKGELVYAATLAERNTHRGLRLNKLSFTDFNHWYLREKRGTNLVVHHANNEVIYKFFNPEFLSFEAAHIKLMNGESVGEPLSRTLGLYTLPTKASPILAYKRWTIGFAPSPFEIVLGEQFEGYRDDLIAQFPTIFLRVE